VDTALQVGILTFEDTADANFVNMATITKTPATGSALATWAPTTAGVAHVNFCSYCIQISGSAVDSTTHLVLFMAGYSSNIVAAQLQDPRRVPSGSTWQGLADWSYYDLTSSLSFSYATDPHADGVVYNVLKKTAYGYELNGSFSPTGVVQIDLAGFLAIPRAGSSGDPAHTISTDPTTVTNPNTGGKVLRQFIW
jgi:hypothetical protein